MYAALNLAIGCGLRFDEDDFSRIAKEFSFDRWGGNSIGKNTGEGLYTHAIVEANMSACVSYEKWLGRPAFICDDVDTCGRSSMTHGSGDRKRGRVGCGCKFPWKGFTVEVTSIGKVRFTACSYKPKPEVPTCNKCGNPDYAKTPDSYYRNEIEKRFTITVEDIRKERAERKAKEGA
jgi:hypothetical protein